MYVTMVVEWDGATANEGMFGLLCVLLVVVPDAKSDYSNKKRVVREGYEHRGIAPQSGGTEQEMNSNRKTEKKGQIRVWTGLRVKSDNLLDCPVTPRPFDLTKRQILRTWTKPINSEVERVYTGVSSGCARIRAQANR